MDKKTTESQSIHRQGIKISTIKSNQKPFFSKKEKGKNMMDTYAWQRHTCVKLSTRFIT
jgi:nucleoside-triphosphatase THEP1